MSDIAIQSGLYEELTNLADTVDDLLLRLRAGKSDPSNPAQKQLAEFLSNAKSGRQTELPKLRLLNLLGCSEPKEKQGWARIGKVLQNNEPVPEAVIQRLELLARQLEARRNEAVAKMRRNR